LTPKIPVEDAKWTKNPDGFDSPALQSLEKANEVIQKAMAGRITQLVEQARLELKKAETKLK